MKTPRKALHFFGTRLKKHSRKRKLVKGTSLQRKAGGWTRRVKRVRYQTDEWFGTSTMEVRWFMESWVASMRGDLLVPRFNSVWAKKPDEAVEKLEKAYLARLKKAAAVAGYELEE